jgi:hypothetical protein
LYFDLRNNPQAIDMETLDTLFMGQLDGDSMETLETSFYHGATLIDEVYVDPITYGCDMHFYYSVDDDAEWDDKLWTPINQNYICKKGYHALPRPILVKYFKIEFTNLVSVPYEPVTFPEMPPITFRRFPFWVEQIFEGNQSGVKDVIVQQNPFNIDPLKFGFVQSSDQLISNYEAVRDVQLTDTTPEVTTFIQSILADTQNDPANQASIESQIEFRSPMMWQSDLISNLDSTRALSRVAMKLRAGIPDTGFSAELPLPAMTTPVQASTTDLSAPLQQKTRPVVYFPIKCRHQYQIVQAQLDKKIAYMAAIKDVQFFRRNFSAPIDETVYLETLDDVTHIAFSDFLQADWRYVVDAEIFSTPPPAGPPVPLITSFFPTSGFVGDTITITGSGFSSGGGGFSGPTTVNFNGTAASFSILDDAHISAVVPIGATTGAITVSTSGGLATSPSAFTVLVAATNPVITSFSPSSGPVATSVFLVGTRFTGVTSITFNGTSAAFSISDDSHITATVPSGATSGLIVATSPGGTGSSATIFTVTPASSPPTISSFSPTSGVVGTSVTINGSGFTGATIVDFNGTSASFVVNTDIKITTTVPLGASTGLIGVTTAGGTGHSGSNFTVTLPVPTISSFSPTSGVAGTTVVINGTGFTGATSVDFNGTSASFTVNSDIKITTTVPGGATTGVIHVITPGGTATSSSNFTFVPAPLITSFNPISGIAGDSISINGSGFTGATIVTFGGVSATFVVNSDILITGVVPVTASTGLIGVTAPGGTAFSPTAFSVTGGGGGGGFTPVAVDLWPITYLNKDKFGLRSRALRIADYPAPAGFSYDSAGYLAKIGSKASPVTITFNNNGISLTNATLADFPGNGTGDAVLGGTATTEFFLRNVEIVGQIQINGSNQTSTADFHPGDAAVQVSTANMPASGRVRLGSPAGVEASVIAGGVNWQAHTPGSGGNNLTISMTSGTAFAASHTGNAWSVTFPAGSTAGNVVNWINGQIAAGQVGTIFYPKGNPASGAATAFTATPLSGGIDPGYEWVTFTSKTGTAINLDPTSSAGASRSYGAGSHVVWDCPIHISNIKRTNAVADGFDDSTRAYINGTQDLNALTGIGAGTATTTLGTNKDILWKTTPGSANGRTKTSVTYVKALPAGTGTLAAKSVSLQSTYLVHTNVGDGGFEKFIQYVASGTVATTTVAQASDVMTVTLRSNAGTSLATAEEVRAACMATQSGTVGTYYKPGTVGTEIVSPMALTPMINRRCVVILATTSGTITSTTADVINICASTARVNDFIKGTQVSGSTTITEMGELVLSTGASGGTLLVTDTNGDLAAARFPAASPSVPLCAYSNTLGAFQYEGYTTSPSPRFTGVSPLVNYNVPTGATQTVVNGEEIKPLFPYEQMWPAEKTGFTCTNAHLRMYDFWSRYSSGEPGISFNSDNDGQTNSFIQYFYNEGYVQDGCKFGATGGNVGMTVANGTVLLHPAAALGHHAPVHTDNFQVNYCDNVSMSFIYVPNAHNSVLFSNVPGANDYPASITRGFVWDTCLLRAAKQGLIPPAYGFNFSGGYVSTAEPATGDGCRNCWFDKNSFGSTNPINFANYVVNPINVNNRWINDGTLIPGST